MRIAFVTSALMGCFAIAADTNAWKQRSIYQLLTDRFAQTTTNTTECTDLKSYCGGTFKGIERQLDYIQDLGFDAIWISPIPENTPLGYHGYWAKNWENVNPYFGNSTDLASLVSAAHAKDMYVMLDVVANHNGEPEDDDFSDFVPFNSAMWYHPACDITDFDNNPWQLHNCKLFSLPDLNTELSSTREYIL